MLIMIHNSVQSKCINANFKNGEKIFDQTHTDTHSKHIHMSIFCTYMYMYHNGSLHMCWSLPDYK